MKYFCVFLLGICFCTGVLAQENESSRPFKLNIVSKKGNSTAFAYFTVSGAMELIPEKKGVLFFENILSDDTLCLLVGDNKYLISIVGIDSIAIAINNNKTSSFNARTGKKESLGKPINLYDNSTTVLNFAESLKEFDNLAEYLKGRAPGVIVSGNSRNGYQISIRGNISLRGSSEPLFIVDGVNMGSYSMVDASLNFSDIAFVEVIKDGSPYGLRGFGGVIKITTKKAN